MISSVEKRTPTAGEGEVYHSTDRSNSKLGASIPAREIVVDAGEETCLGEAQEPPGSHETRPTFDKAHAKHRGAPEHPDSRD